MKILIVGHFSARASTACALRVRGIALTIKRAGHDVHIIDNCLDAPARGVEWTLANGICGTSLNEYRGTVGHRLKRGIRGLFLGNITEQYVVENFITADAIILYGTHLGYLVRMRRLAKKIDAAFITDVVEWYSGRDLPGGFLGPFSASNLISMRWYSLKSDGFIVISERLKKHYQQSGRPVALIPPIFEPLDRLGSKWSENDRRLHVCYAGSPGRKEAFDILMPSVAAAAQKGLPMTLHLIGVTREQIESYLIDKNIVHRLLMSGHLIFYGRIPNDHARDIVSKCDFAIVIRRLNKSNHFGFPSKVVESLSLGTPVISNLFSDLFRHLKDRKNALIIQRVSVACLEKCLDQASNLSTIDRRDMAEAALATAKSDFSPKRNRAFLSDLLQKTHASRGR